mmetsp:Transcript_6684/g.10535  ORF Transcript_6684/g.10535 Transcript_6684/m.10535 type:complete len:400 (+) Transcript_6684:20-1219(+)
MSADKGVSEGGGVAEVDAGNDGDKRQMAIWSKFCVIDEKIYYFDVRKNTRGLYLKVTEVNAQKRRNTVLVQPKVLDSLLDLLKAAIQGELEPAADVTDKDLEGHGVTITSCFLDIPPKKYYIDLGQNKWHRYLKLVESQSGFGRSVVLIPESGWLQIKRLLDELKKDVPDFCQRGQNIDSKAKGPKTNGKFNTKAGGKRTNQKQPSTPPQPPVTVGVVSSPPEGDDKSSKHGAHNKSVLMSRTIQTQYKRFFFDLQENDMGRFLKVAQLSRGTRETVVLPIEFLAPLAELCQAYIDKDTSRKIDKLEIMVPKSSLAHAPENTPDNTKKSPQPKHKVETLSAHSFQSENGKIFFMDFRESSFGKYFRLSERKSHRRTAISVPEDCFAAFKQVLGEVVVHK